MWRRDKGRSGAALVADCEAFLAGRYLEHVDPPAGLAPPWTWMNLLAHGTVEQLAAALAMSGSGAPSDRSSRTWHDARAFLATEVLEAAGGEPGRVRDLQARVLVPLELDLVDVNDVDLSPRAMVSAVVRALEDDRRQVRRRRDTADREPPLPK